MFFYPYYCNNIGVSIRLIRVFPYETAVSYVTREHGVSDVFLGVFNCLIISAYERYHCRGQNFVRYIPESHQKTSRGSPKIDVIRVPFKKMLTLILRASRLNTYNINMVFPTHEYRKMIQVYCFCHIYFFFVSISQSTSSIIIAHGYVL